MMDALLSALEANLVHFTLWNYNPANSDAHGDAWNGENFSWFSQARAGEERERDELEDGDGEGGWWDAGGRLLGAISVRFLPDGIPLGSSFSLELSDLLTLNSLQRPYPIALAGVPISSTYDSLTASYELRFTLPSTDVLRADELSSTETELFFPSRTYGVRHAPSDILIDASEGKIRWDRPRQRLILTTNERTDIERSVRLSVRIKGVREREVQRNRLLATVGVGLVALAIGLSPELRAWLAWIWSCLLVLLAV